MQGGPKDTLIVEKESGLCEKVGSIVGAGGKEIGIVVKEKQVVNVVTEGREKST